MNTTVSLLAGSVFGSDPPPSYAGPAMTSSRWVPGHLTDVFFHGLMENFEEVGLMDGGNRDALGRRSWSIDGRRGVTGESELGVGVVGREEDSTSCWVVFDDGRRRLNRPILLSQSIVTVSFLLRKYDRSRRNNERKRCDVVGSWTERSCGKNSQALSDLGQRGCAQMRSKAGGVQR